MTRNPLGSIWSRWDLHLHTPASYDYRYSGVSPKEIVETLLAENVSLVAVTDHHRIDIDFIEAMRSEAAGRLTVLPGIELRSEIGSDQVHYIGIFSEEINLAHLWDTLRGNFGLTPQGLADQGGDEGVYRRLPDAARVIRDELGGLISIHAGAKSNSIDRISNQDQFQRRIKYDVAKDFVDLLEIGQLKDVGRYLDIIFPATGLGHPLIIGSDNHDIRAYEVTVPCWIKAEPTFLGLKQVLNEPRSRVHLGGEPPHLSHVRQNRASYLKSVRFGAVDGSDLAGQWFDGVEVELNTGLVALIGNQGSGKSAFADAVGLLGHCPHLESFSFLNESHFRHPKDNKAAEFEATLTWQNAATKTASLGAEVPAGAVQTIRYIPQFHLDAICDELEGGRAGKFDAELRQVIFSRVSAAKRMKADSLEELIRLRTADSRTRIDTLRIELQVINETAAELEARSTDQHRLNLEGRIQALEEQLSAVDGDEPQEPKPPELDPETRAGQEDLRKRLEASQRRVETLTTELAEAEKELGDLTAKSDAAGLIRAKLEALGVAVERARTEIEPLTELLDVHPDFFRLTIDDAQLSAKEAAVEGRNNEVSDLLDPDADDGLPARLASAREEEGELRRLLGKSDRDYQDALDARRKWHDRRNALVGDLDTPGTLEFERASRAALKDVPKLLADNHEEQIRIALEILAEKERILAVYQDLYAPVQQFIDSHPTAHDRFGLEFDVGLTPASFSGLFLDQINQAKRGTFYGEKGRDEVQSRLSKTDFRDPKSVEIWLHEVHDALHVDRRDGADDEPRLVTDQLRQDYSVSALYDFLFSLEYLEPRYNLSWGGRPIEKLSPGQRGSLILVFYLLVDDGREPLVIDQPEGNLDNQTVYELLVSCIKEAKERRQIIIVTHNPNLAVVCDAEQVVYCALDKDNNSRLSYSPGALENPETCERIINVLEGTRPAIDNRIKKYRLLFD